MFKALIDPVKQRLSKLIVQQEDVVGVDIMPGYIRIAELDQSGKNWTITKVGYRYVQGHIDINDLKTNPDGYSSKLQQVCEKNKVSTSSAAVSIPVSSAVIQVVTLPLMSDEELDEAIGTDSLWENVVQLPDPLEEYSIFHQVIKRHSSENTMDLLFVASKLSDIEDYMNIIRQAGLNPVVVDVRCFSLRNALDLRKKINLKQPIGLLEFGPFENYLLILDKEGAPFIAEIYISDTDKELLGTSATDTTNDFTKLSNAMRCRSHRSLQAINPSTTPPSEKSTLHQPFPRFPRLWTNFNWGLPVRHLRLLTH